MKKLHLILLVVISAMILASLVACDADDIGSIIGGLGGGSVTLPEGQGGNPPALDGIENIELPEELIEGHTPVIDPYLAPTCTKTGLTPGAHCADCGEVLVAQQEIPMTEHVYDNERDRDCNVCGYIRNTKCRHRNVEKLEGKPATCTEFGLTDGTKCRDCGEILAAQTLIPMAEHTESDWIIDKEATVDADGSRHTECTNCGARIKAETINKLIPSKGLIYTLNADSKSYSVTGIGTCTDTDLIIPSTYKGKPVTAIGKNAFWECKFLNSVSIPNSVTSIGECAFLYCTSLTNIRISDSVNNIESEAFWLCYSLTNISVDDNNKTYKSIDGNLYTKDETTLIQYTIGKKDTSFAIPDSVTNIASHAFDDAASLINITIPNGVKKIGDSAFHYCTSLTSVTIPDSVTIIGWSAFSYCKSLTSVTIPDGVTSIDNYAFASCKSLTSVTIPDSVTSIGSYVFEDCTSLTSINIPNSVTSIGDGAFENTGITDIEISIDHPYFTYFDGVLYTKDLSKIILVTKGVTEITLPSGITSIPRSAFKDCTSLTSVTIPDSVTSIGYGAFWGCTSLTSVTISDSITIIGWNAFRNCTSLTSITIPDSVTSIGDDAFYGCTSLTSVTIPDSVTSIGASAFSRCTSLTSVTMGNGVTSIGDYAFCDCTSLTSIIVDENNANYKSIDGNLYTKDGKTLVQYAIGKKDASFVIPDSVTSIGDHAFRGCTSLTNVTIPDSVTSIGYYAFCWCTSLTDIYYNGTKSEWNAISKTEDWDSYTPSYTIYCTDGDITK